MNRKKGSGHTLTEVLIAIVVLGLAGGLILFGQRMLNWAHLQLNLASLQRDAQVNLYGITRDVKNAKKILSLSSSTLVFTSYNFENGFDTLTFFEDVNIGTITYQYINTSTGSAIKKIQDFNGIARVNYTMKNLLLTVDATNYLFSPYPSDATPPYDAVQIVFRCGQGFFKDAQRLYQAEAMVKSRD